MRNLGVPRISFGEIPAPTYELQGQAQQQAGMTRGNGTAEMPKERDYVSNEWNRKMAMKWEMGADGSQALNCSQLEGFVDFVVEVFDADVVAVDFFDEALAAEGELFGSPDLIGRGVTPEQFPPTLALA